MAKYQSKYRTETEEHIKRALLELLEKRSLAQITVSELSDCANVSRSTFYQHYGNVGDVYAELVSDFRDRVAPIAFQVGPCRTGCKSPDSVPFCHMLRRQHDLSPVISEASFLSTFIETEGKEGSFELAEVLKKAGIDEQTARALSVFQLCGCFAATRSSAADDAQWETTRAYIDSFIKGGIEACIELSKGTSE
jgi:AcrR family transcriptional regulator